MFRAPTLNSLTCYGKHSRLVSAKVLLIYRWHPLPTRVQPTHAGPPPVLCDTVPVQEEVYALR